MPIRLPRVFLSLGRDLQDDVPTMRTAAFNALGHLADMAVEKKICLIARDQPVVGDFLMDRLGCPSENLFLVGEHELAKYVLFDHTPGAAFFIGGDDAVAVDYDFFCRAPDVTTVPLPETGGAAYLAEHWHRANGRERAKQLASGPDQRRIENVMHFLSARYYGPQP